MVKGDLMGFFLVSGVIRDLIISKGYENILFSQDELGLLGLGAIGAAAIGEGLGSKILAGSGSDAQIEMEFFTCFVGDDFLQGRFYNVEFKNGEFIHFVVEKYFGKNNVVAARDSVSRLVWTMPYRTKGHIAQRISNIKGVLLSSLSVAVTSFIAALFCNDQGDEITSLYWSSAWIVALFGFLSTLIIGFRVCRRVYRNSVNATNTFELLNFAEPQNVDLPKNHRRAEKIYEAESGEEVAWSPNPLRFRYDICSLNAHGT